MQPPPPAPAAAADTEQPRIRGLTAEFAERDAEQRFRAQVLGDWRQRASLAIWVGAIAFMVIGINDYVRLGLAGEFFVLAALRASTALTAAVFFAVMSFDRRVNTFIAAVFAAEACFTLAFCALVAMIPDRVAINTIMAIALVLAYQLFVPTRAILAVAAGICCTIAYVVTVAVWTPTGQRDLIAIATVMTVLNIIGAATVYRLHALHRQGFALLDRERRTNERLEKQSRKLAKLAGRLARARDEANHANRAKSEFLAHMSHELRTPLNAINGFSEIIKDELFGPVAPRYRDYAADIFRSGMHLTALINDVLDLSKIEAGKLEVDEAIVEPAALVESCIRLVRDRAHKASLRLLTELPPDLPLLRADERLVKQMLLNLLTNAVKFTPEGGHVTISAGPGPDGGLAFAVRDTGVGIAAEDIPRALEPYGQVATARERNPDGIGLGLPLVKKMAELHGGTLELESAPALGTTATIVFPRERVVAADRPARALPVAKAG
ncbi:MAG TPA: ATP-binding protein [Alphaproteobacteria bacterium]|nr:ATP-binding protein [Alphaproteobacteria bacterium]